MTSASAVAAAMAEQAWPLLIAHYKPTCCIPATAIACDVFHHYGIAAEPMVVTAVVLNRAASHLLAKGCGVEQLKHLLSKWSPEDRGGPWTVGIGVPVDSVPDDLWNGHLVCVAPEEGLLVDLSIPQASRPHKRLNLTPVIADLPQGWPDTPAVVQHPDGTTIRYTAQPANHTYSASPQWQPAGLRRQVQEQIAAHLIAGVADAGDPSTLTGGGR